MRPRTPRKQGTRARPFVADMSFWPIVAPRALLPEVRRLVSRHVGRPYFDAAFAAMDTPSHADLLGKASLLLRSRASHNVPCPAQRSPFALARGREAHPSPWSCLGWVFPVEHVRHPMQGCHTSCGRFKNYAQAAEYARALLNASAAFVRGGPIPPALFHYRANLSAEQEHVTRAFLLRSDPGRICGLGRQLAMTEQPRRAE